MTNRWVILALVFVARLSFGVQFQAIAAAGPGLVDDLQLTYAQLGWLIGLYSLPGMIVAFPGGFLGRRFGERPVAVVGLALMVVGALITGWSTSFTVALVGRVLSGAGFVVANTMFSKMIADWFAGKEIATAMGVLLSAWPMGIALALVSLGALAMAPSETSASPMPAGHAVSMIAIAVAISLPANQSATIFANTVFAKMKPAPLSVRPTAATAKLPLDAVISAPTAMSASPAIATGRSPKRRPRSPPGNASTTPGNENNPMSQPTSA